MLTLELNLPSVISVLRTTVDAQGFERSSVGGGAVEKKNQGSEIMMIRDELSSLRAFH